MGERLAPAARGPRRALSVSGRAAPLETGTPADLGRLPELCDHVERHRDVWGDEDAVLAASDAVFEAGRATIEEHPDLDLAVVTVADDGPAPAPEAGGHRFAHEWVTGLHPMAVNNRTERVTLARLRGRSGPCRRAHRRRRFARPPGY